VGYNRPHAVHAYQIELLTSKDSRILIDLINVNEIQIPVKKISTVLLKILGRDSIFANLSHL